MRTVSDVNGVARVLVVLLLAGLVSMFVAVAADVAMPAPVNPYESLDSSVPPAKQAEWDATRSEIEAKLADKQISQEQADEQLAIVDEAESSYYEANSPSEAVLAAYDKATAERTLVVSLVSMVFVAILLAVGVVMTRRALPLAAVPLFAGALLGIYAIGMGAQADVAWVRIAISGAVALGAAGAGLKAFERPSTD